MSTLSSTASEWPWSRACLSAVGTLMARSPICWFWTRESAGKERTSVTLFLPRNRRLRLRMLWSVVNRTETWHRKRSAFWARARKRARVRGDGTRALRPDGAGRDEEGLLRWDAWGPAPGSRWGHG